MSHLWMGRGGDGVSCEHEWEGPWGEVTSIDTYGNEITVYSAVYLRCGLCGAESMVSVIGEGIVEVTE